ncbi:MAG: transposase [Clostridiales bacterium]|nr:transposase [Clostridiales bacterium]
MKKCRSIRTEKANLELIWDLGPAQVDFGEADFYEAGKLCRKKYLTVSFPYSNDGYSQVFGGETAECVCQGLQDIFEFIGGVPPLLIFDNATGVGRRIGDAIHESELFSRFRAHYHFRVRFCNPYSGWEKGNVERKVDYNRANLFVPVPHFNEIEKYNQKLLARHEKKASELHYKKQVPIRELFEEDRKALLMLPPKRFDVCRYIIKDYQRLKKDEAERLAIGWDVKRELSKINYRIHTDAVKEFLITPTLSQQEMAYTYASEVDILNMALFGKTAAQWRNKKGISGKTPNIRDFASAEELVVLINLEDTNADLIRQEVPKIERLKILREKAYRQLEILKKNQEMIEDRD